MFPKKIYEQWRKGWVYNLKICFLIANISGSGGTERVTSVLANGLLQKGHKIEILSCQGNNDIKYNLEMDVSLYSLHADKIHNSVARKLYTFYRIKKRIDLQKFDFVIAVDVYLYLYLFPLKFITSCRYIAWEHFNLSISNFKGTNLARLLAVKYADAVVVLGKHDYENYKKKYKKSRNITYIYNPIAYKLCIPNDINKHRLIAVGRLVEQKGFDLLIKAWKIIEENNLVDSDWHLDIYGTGALEKTLKNLIQQFHLKRISLKGYSKNIDQELKEAAGFVLSSRYEGFVLVLLEAQAMGLPCVSFDCKEGPSEIIINNVNGFLVENGNVAALAEKMKEIMCNDEIRKTFSENAHMNLKRFNIDTILEKWEMLFKRISTGKKFF